jgi:hypothetical protein
MFDKSKVTENLFGLVGFDNPATPYDIVDVDNQEARSGRTATENPFCKIPQLKETQDDVNITDVAFNEFLTKLQKKSISDVVDSVIIDPSYIDRQLLYQNVNNKINTETFLANFVGYRINKSKEKNVAFEITRCILEFEGTGDIELVLFNSAISEPIKSETVTITKKTQTVQLDWKIDNSGDYFQGDFFIGYFTDGLTVKPYERDYQSSNVRSVITHLCFTPISVNGTAGQLFDLDNIDNQSECWGLNPDISVYYDYTDLIIQNERLFAPAIQLQMCINTIQHYIASGRSNRTERISREQLNMLVAQLEGVNDSIEGLKPTVKKEVYSLSKQLKRLVDGYFPKGFILNSRL